VDDIPETFALKGPDGIRLLVVGTIKAAGAGCFCPENALVRRLIHHLVLAKEEILIMDMEAGIEHLGRGTVKVMDILLIILEPGLRSIKVAHQIKKLGEELGIKRFSAILNKVQNTKKDKEKVEKRLVELDIQLIGCLPFNKGLVEGDLDGTPPFEIEGNQDILNEIEKIRESIEIIVDI
jgi:CO dehydrogenase maturation factor